MNANRFDTGTKLFASRRFSRRQALTRAGAALGASALIGPGVRPAVAHGSATPAPGPGNDPATDIVAIAQDFLARYHLRAVIARATIGGEEAVTTALGESMTGVPATADMRFRNGAVAMSYMSTLLLQLVDRGTVGLDDLIATWVPELPDADRVTLRMLANMTSGYHDYVRNADLQNAFYSNPFRAWEPDELIAFGMAKPRIFEPGTNWDYSHTGYVILGQALERIADAPLDVLLQENILDPLGLTGTTSTSTAVIPEPALHAFTSERKEFLGIDPATRFYEESSFWSPSWTIAQGAIMTTTIHDMTSTAEAIGTGTLLSPESHQAQVGNELLGFGAPLEGCDTCHTLVEDYVYGLGIVLVGPWLLQNPLFAGYGAIEAYLPSKQIAIAVTTTFGEDGFDDQGNNLHERASWEICAAISAYLAPDEALPAERA